MLQVDSEFFVHRLLKKEHELARSKSLTPNVATADIYVQSERSLARFSGD